MRWQKIFVPNMQTGVLKALLSSPKNWADQQLISEELDSRATQAEANESGP